MPVKILIDSASDLTEQEANNLGLILLPIKIQFGEDEYLDGVNLLPDEFYDKLSSSKELPKTSLINEYQFDEKFAELTSNGDDVIVITLSSKLSGTYRCALEASKNYEGKVFVVDSLNACLGERILCDYALTLANKGLSAKEIAELLEIKKLKINVFAVIDTLKYLKKGGRISAATAFVGEILSIKPLIAVIDGEVKVVGKCHGLKKGYLSISDMVNKKGGIDFNMPHGLIWSGTDMTNINNFKTISEKFWKDCESNIETFRLGNTIGAHIGPGAVGVAFFEK